MAGTHMYMTVHSDVSEFESDLDRLIAKARELRYLQRPWWCPRWLFILLNGDR